MKNLFTLLLFSVFFCLSFIPKSRGANDSLAQNTAFELIYFDFDKAELSATEQLKLDAFIRSNINKGKKLINVNINGHTDSYGSDTYNIELSKKRATTVYYRILQLGIPESLVNYQGFGEQQLIIPKGDQMTQKENRRVTVTLTLEAIKEIKTIETQPKIDATLTLSDLYQNTKKPYDAFTIRAGEVAFIKGKNTRLQFMSDAFSHLPKGTPIEIRMTEYYDYSDMILANLTTEIDGKMLSTNGMIHVEAFIDGQPTNMTGQAYVWFPKSEYDDMQPYFGEEGEEGVTWARLAGNINETDNLQKYYTYLKKVGEIDKSWSYTLKGRKLSKWQKFRHIVLFGRDYYQRTITDETKIVRDIEYVYGPDTIDVYKAFKNFSNNDVYQKQMQYIINNEILSINKLGWINCDRFYDIPQEQKRDLAVDTKPDNNLSIKVICKKEKGIMAAYPNNKNYIAGGLPKNLNVTVVAIRTSNDKPELAIKKLSKVQDLDNDDLEFVAYDNLDDFRKALKALD
ncbi:MAG: OmpA family protein [Saprospiraceae bacterium]